MKLSDMDFLSSKDELTWEKVNNTSTSGRVEVDIMQRFCEVAAANPSQQAISIKNGNMTYEELNAYSNQIAHFLVAQGIKPGDAIAIVFGVTPHLYAAILSILKVGGFYVPIGLDYPEERIQYVLKNAQVRFLLTETTLLANGLEIDPTAPCIVLNEHLPQKAANVFDARDLENYPKDTICLKVDAHAPMYMIYTSGTTGKPKGIKISRDNVMNFVYWYCDVYGVSEKSRLAQNAPIAFDPSVQQIFSAFVSGATLIPVPREIRTDPYLFLTWLREERITHLDIVTSHWTHLLTMLDKTSDSPLSVLPDLSWIVIGGEALYYHQTYLWHKLVQSPVRISGVYGPTEATVNATYFMVDPEKAEGKVPIGKPLPNYQIYVVNKQGKLCPPFVFGEIYIGGRGVALSYQDENQSQSAFVPNFISGKIGEKLYKTGDIGRLVIEGEQNAFFEFKERADSQVKVSGYRIEPGEIEAVAKGFSKIQDAAVVVRGDGIEKQLICFFASSEAEQVDLQNYLRSKLPEYMLPSSYLKVDNIPYTLNGKIDRSELLEIYERKRKVENKTNILPGTPLEKTILALWQDIFKIDVISIYDNFFELGGNSYIALNFLANLQANTDVVCRIADIYNHPTLADLANYLEKRTQKERNADKLDPLTDTRSAPQNIEDEQSNTSQKSLVPQEEIDLTLLIAGAIQPERVLTEVGEIEMSPSICQDLLRGTHLSALTAINMQIKMEVEKEILEKVFRDVLAAHPLLCTSIRKVAPDKFVFVEYSFENIVLPYCDLQAYGSEGIEALIGSLQNTFARQLNIAKPPLFCFLLIREQTKVFRLVWFISHLISDGESINILSREIQDRYWSYILSQPYQGNQENSYQDYVQGIHLARVKEPDLLPYVRYIERYIDVVTNVNRYIELLVDKEPTSFEQRLVVRTYASPNAREMNSIHILYAAYTKAISLLCGIHSIPVTSVYHGRAYNWSHKYLNVIGNLTDAIPVLISLHENMQTNDLLSEIAGVLNFVNMREINYSRLFDQIREIKGDEYFFRNLLNFDCPLGFNFFEENHLEDGNSNEFALLTNVTEEYGDDRKISISLSTIACGDQLQISLLGSHIKRDAMVHLWDLFNKEIDHFNMKIIQE